MLRKYLKIQMHSPKFEFDQALIWRAFWTNQRNRSRYETTLRRVCAFIMRRLVGMIRDFKGKCRSTVFIVKKHSYSLKTVSLSKNNLI